MLNAIQGKPLSSEGRDPMKLTINGRDREFPELELDSSLPHLIELLQLKADRVAVERNGDIVARATWSEVRLENGDRLEVVQFVGGGLESTRGEIR
ncbi:MAG: sulfur carrier protein ThiS [Acidobacteriaceae bacterium]